MYLGVHIDSQLNFNQEIKYLRERASTRLSTMKYMTSLKEGANLEVQRKYYTACTRSLIDYAAPVLTNLTDRQKQSLEVLQNNAARLMLGAPMWTKLGNLREEANLPSLDSRIKVRNTCILAKALVSDRNSYTKIRAATELAKNREIQNYNTYSKQITDCVKDLGITNTLLELKTDKPDNNFNIPPWETLGTKFNYAKLPRAKEQCSKEELQRAATAAIAQTETPESKVYYTDGTVDPETITTGAAVYSSRFTGCWRVSNSASTMQTELVALKQALNYSLHNEQGPVTIHTDCKSAVQALQQIKIKENKSLLKNIQYLLYQHKTMNRQVTINWIPSHIEIYGNDQADELAKTTRHIANVQIKVQPTISQIKKQLAPTIKNIMKEEIKTQARLGSPSSNWYLQATDLVPHPVTKGTPRQLAVIIHRLRLGYKATWQMIEGVARPCNYCEDTPDAPLMHYLLECPQTASLRDNRGNPLPLNNDTAAKIAKNIIEYIETYQDFLIRMPPPR